jgi:hypothetical protein
VQERGAGDSFGPASHLGATDQLKSHGVEQVLLRKMRGPVFAHPAKWRGP